MTGRAVRFAAVTALLLAGGVVPAGTVGPAAAARPGTRTWSIRPTTREPAPISFRVTTKAVRTEHANEGTLLVLRVADYGDGVRRIGDYGIGGVGADLSVRWYGVAGVPHPGCERPCDTTNGTHLFDGWWERERSPLRGSEWFVAADNVDVAITVSRGWRVREIPNRLTVINGHETGATGVRWNNVTVERFRHAEAPGGKHGSWAFGLIPCTSAGVGSAEFRGGQDDLFEPVRPRLTCDRYLNALAAQVSRRATTWRLTGEVTGWTSWPTRLAVFSLPW